MAEKILVVEDEASLRETISYNLLREGYEVITAEDGRQALEYARQNKPHLVILDVMLPHIDGFDVCRLLRQETNVPILMLTARTTEIDRVLGLEIGADDYMDKPFSMREFLARVKALLRRVRMDFQSNETQKRQGDDKLIFGDLIISPSRREVHQNDILVSLKPKEYELLLFFAKNHGKVLSREVILQQVWDWSFRGGSRTVDVHIRWLREKLEPDPANPQRLITIRGAGYRFDG
jgi:DNA-binding response OmpR family regulator